MPWLFFALIFGLPFAGMIYGYLTERLKSQERIKAMEKGLPLPPEAAASNPWPALSRKTPWERADDLRLAGLICIAVGIGLSVLLGWIAWTIDKKDQAITAVGAIPALIGVVLLYEGRRRMRDLGPRPPAQPPLPKS